jgi:hypothetical protein
VQQAEQQVDLQLHVIQSFDLIHSFDLIIWLFF